ncbi:hypothetical protein BC829DRAFT_267775 [Chytridium lagenaria]|nr:hypothetical protein BC829DRAFT_267775 [Chytridium lagenaria]
MLDQRMITVAPWIRSLAPLRHPQKIRSNLVTLAVWGVTAGLLRPGSLSLHPLPEEIFSSTFPSLVLTGRRSSRPASASTKRAVFFPCTEYCKCIIPTKVSNKNTHKVPCLLYLPNL